MSVATRILVVDDEPDVELLINQQFRRQIRAGEFTFSFARDGEQALTVLQNDAGFDLMLLDMTIPGAPSHEVAIEAVRVQPDMRLILTSAFGKEIIAGSMNASQTHGFIRKPFRIQDLLNLLRATLASQPIAGESTPGARPVRPRPIRSG